MANGIIVYNSQSLNLTRINAFTKTMNEERHDNFSASRKHEAIHVGSWDEITVSLKTLINTEMHTFYDWWSWARLGNVFTFALDSGLNSSTTLDAGAAAAQTTVPLTATTGLAEDDYCLIKEAEAAGDDYEIVKIATVNTGVSIVTAANLRNTYASGDIFRNIDYWPTVVVKETSLPLPTIAPGKHWSFTRTFIEVK